MHVGEPRKLDSLGEMSFTAQYDPADVPRRLEKEYSYIYDYSEGEIWLGLCNIVYERTIEGDEGLEALWRVDWVMGPFLVWWEIGDHQNVQLMAD